MKSHYIFVLMLLTLSLNSNAKENKKSLCYLIFKAVDNKNTKMIQFLIQKGADLNCVNIDGNSPFLKAFINKDYKTAKYLLDHGALIDFENTKIRNKTDTYEFGESALSFAVKNKDLKGIRFIINNLSKEEKKYLGDPSVTDLFKCILLVPDPFDKIDSFEVPEKKSWKYFKKSIEIFDALGLESGTYRQYWSQSGKYYSKQDINKDGIKDYSFAVVNNGSGNFAAEDYSKTVID